MGRRSEGRGSVRAHGVRARPSPLGLPVARPRLMGRHVGERRADTYPLDNATGLRTVHGTVPFASAVVSVLC